MKHPEHSREALTRKPCSRWETARFRCKFWSISSLLALCWSNISRGSRTIQYTI